MKKLVALLVFLCIGCGMNNSSLKYGVEEFSPEKEIHDVSIIQLIARPENFHQMKVRIQGFATIEFEGTAIYLSKEFLTPIFLKMRSGLT